MNKINLNLNNNIGFRNLPAEQIQTEGQYDNVPLPYIYQPTVDPNQKTFKEKVKQVDMMGIVYPWIAHPLLTLGTAATIAVGVDKFSEACGGEYSKSLVGKAAKLGDDIANSSVVKSKPSQKVIGWWKTGSKKVSEKFKNSDLINAIRKTPSQAEWAIVKDETLNMRQRMVHEFSGMTRTLKLVEDGFVPLSKLGLDKADNEFLTQLFKDSKILEEQASNAIQLKRLGKFSDAEILNIVKGSNATQRVKDETINLFGNGITKEYLQQIDSKVITPRDTLIVENACKNAKNVRIGDGNLKWLGKVQPFERKITCSELYNRLHSMGSGAKTKTGKSMAKFLQKCHRGFTFGGGKMNALFFVAPFLVESIVATMKADKNEKVGTAAHGLIESISWVFTFPLAVQIMHHLAGSQYAGMGKAKVAEYRNLINQFNDKVKGNKFASMSEYKAARKQLKLQLKELEKVKGQNLLTKISRKLGKFVTLDLETIKSFRGGSALENTVRKIPNFFKNVVGVPMRFAIWAGISMGVLDVAINKGVKLIFGNYHDRFKAEEHENAKKEQKKFLHEDLQNRLHAANYKKLNTPPEVIENPVMAQNTEEPVLNQATAVKDEPIMQQPITMENPLAVEQKVPEIKETSSVKPQPTYTYIPSQDPNPEIFANKKTVEKRDNYTYIPSSENLLNKNGGQVRKYIPSQTAAKFTKTFDNSGLEAALRRADRAEQKAIETLAGNFGGY